MRLLYQTHSPYARKVLVAAHEMGMQHRLCVIHHETSPTRRNEEVLALNPLGQAMTSRRLLGEFEAAGAPVPEEGIL